MMKYLLAILLLSFSSVLSAQTVDSTGNLIDPTKWGNVIPMNSGQLVQVEGEGGGPVPAYNTDTNTIRFSYFPYTVSQIIAINTALSGQGISVSGFNYSWKIWNDLQNCCGTRGTLLGNVSFFNNSGKLLESYNYDYSNTNTGANFQLFSGTQSFNSPYQLNSLGDVSVSWTGSDMNFWSGYYGPRVRETSLSLNYSVKQSSPTPTTDSTSTSTTSSTINDIIASAAEPVAVTTTTPPITETTQTTVISNTTTNQEKTQEKDREMSGPSLSSILTNIRNNEQRQQSIAMAAVASSNQLAMSVTEQAEKTALNSASSSTTAGTSTDIAGSPITFVSSQLRNTVTPVTLSNVSNSSIFSLRPDIKVDATVDNQSLVQEVKPMQLRPPAQIFTNNQLSETTNSFNIAFGKRGDPIQDYIETNNSMFNEMKSEPRPTTVRPNVQDNDLAGGIRIERLAVVPNGFNAYSQFILTNIAFYEPKEIYKNNVPKDNVRSMYFLEKGNTDTYNRMIEGQYK